MGKKSFGARVPSPPRGSPLPFTGSLPRGQVPPPAPGSQQITISHTPPGLRVSLPVWLPPLPASTSCLPFSRLFSRSFLFIHAPCCWSCPCPGPLLVSLTLFSESRSRGSSDPRVEMRAQSVNCAACYLQPRKYDNHGQKTQKRLKDSRGQHNNKPNKASMKAKSDNGTATQHKGGFQIHGYPRLFSFIDYSRP